LRLNINHETIHHRNWNRWETIASAIITESLEADYWKPIQAGDLENSDSHKVKLFFAPKKQ
jgi:dethiobiotin synthetase